MTVVQLAPPYPVFTGRNGDPLDNGYLYFGASNQNPETNPIQVYWDTALTQPAAQPIRTINGYPSRNGAPALIYAGSQYSVTVRDKNNEFVIYSPLGFGVVTGGLTVQRYSGDGSTVAFTLATAPNTENNTQVYVSGVYQQKNTYEVSGTTLTLSAAPPIGTDNIEVVMISTLALGEIDSATVLAALVGQQVVAAGFTGTLDGVLGGGTPAAVTGTALTLTTGSTVTTVLDEDNMASNSAAALSTQQSIKAYVDAGASTLAASTGAGLVGYTQGSTGSVARTVQSALRDTVSVKDFGAVGDGVTDDTAAINLALAYVRSLENAANLLRPVVLTGGGGRYLISGSLNATLIRLGKGWGLRDIHIIASCAGKTALDLTASRFGYFENVHIWGSYHVSDAITPHTGILLAPADPATSYPCDSHTWLNCSVDGYFTTSAYTEYGSEVTSATACIYWNRRDDVTHSGGGPSWAAVLQGRPTIPIVSDFVASIYGDGGSTAPGAFASGRVSYTLNHYDMCRFQKPFGRRGPTMYIEDLSSTLFTKPYVTNGFGDSITWKVNTDYVPYSVEFNGLQIETTGNDKGFVFTGAGVGGAGQIRGLHISCGNIFTEDAMLDVSDLATMTLSDFKLKVQRWQGSGPTDVFANSAKFKIAGGEITLPATADMEAYSTFISGTNYKLYTNDSFVERQYGSLRLSEGVPFFGEGGLNSTKGGSMADDTAISIPLTTNGFANNGVIFLWSSSAAGLAATIHFRASASPVALLESLGTSVQTVTATTLTGTTGTNGYFTVAINDDEIMFENRKGFTVTYRYFILSYNASI